MDIPTLWKKKRIVKYTVCSKGEEKNNTEKKKKHVNDQKNKAKKYSC